MYTKAQSKNKIVDSKSSGLTTMHLTHLATSYPKAIELTALEAMWIGHEENIDHPAGEEYPIGTNKEHMSLMIDRVIDSVNHREGIDINSDYEIEFMSCSYPATS